MFDVFGSAFGGVFAILHAIVIIYALVAILGSKMDTMNKILWFLVVAIFPLVGLIIYLLIGRKN